MTDRRRDLTRYLWGAFITVILIVLVYYLLQEIPHAVRPTLHPVSTRTVGPTG